MKAKTAKQKAAMKAAQLAASRNNAAALQELETAMKVFEVPLRLAIRNNNPDALAATIGALLAVADSAPARIRNQALLEVERHWHHALMLAARLNRIESTLKLAVGQGRGYAALQIALRLGRLALFEALLANSEPELIERCGPLLGDAVRRGKTEFVAPLLTHEPLRALNLLVPLVKASAGNTKMIATLARGATHLYGYMVDPTSGEGFDVEGFNLLMSACIAGDMGLVRLLLPVTDLAAIDSRGCDIDHWARNNDECVRLLAEERARRVAAAEASVLAGVVYPGASFVEADSSALARMSALSARRARQAVRI